MAHVSSVALGPFRCTERKNRRAKCNGWNMDRTSSPEVGRYHRKLCAHQT